VTIAFLEQLAHWGPTVCLVRGGVLELGALYLPRLGEFWYARRGQGAWRDGVRLHVERVPQIERYHSMCVPSRFHLAMPIAWPGKVRALGSSAVHLAQVACGGSIAAVIPRWSLWDVGCGLLLVEESGGVITDLAAQPLDPFRHPGAPILAGDPIAIRHLVAQFARSHS